MPFLRLPAFRWRGAAVLLLAVPFAVPPLLDLQGGMAFGDSIRSAEWPLDAYQLDAERAWKTTKGAGVTVAVVDSGVSASHPDLIGQVLPGMSLLGDHGDGRTDTSGDSHGTAIAGIIAATGSSSQGTGMTGLAPEAKILPVRVSSGSEVDPTTLAQGITWAVDHGAQVINVSIGSPNPDPLLGQAVAYALRKQAVVVASAGNQGQQGNPPQYPAAFPGVVSVAGVDQNGKFWAPSESGAGIVLAAPATGIYSTNDLDSYVDSDGTSFATAYVSAAAALIRAHFPDLTAGQVVRRLIDTAKQHHTRPDPHLGYGIVDPAAALTNPTTPSTDQSNPLLTATAVVATRSSSTWTGWLLGLGGVTAAVAAAVPTMRRRRQRLATPVSNQNQTPLPRDTRNRAARPTPPKSQRSTPTSGRRRS